jgi:amino acid adenylation domain-containing protein
MANNTIAGFKLSLQQERIWLQQGNLPAFRTTCVLRIHGAVEPSKLRNALQHVMDRHEILRTVFPRQAGVKVPFQVIQDKAALHWEYQSSGDALPDPHSIQFELENGPVVHARLTRTAAGEHTLTLQMPALVADAQSLQTLAAELGHAHQGSSAAEPPDDVLQYADYVEWQNELLQGEDTKAGREFWRDYCRKLDFSVQPSLPLEGKAEPQSYTPDVLFASLDSALLARIKAVAQKHALGISDLLAACWCTVLSRLTGESDLTLGYNLDGRKYAELEGAVGPFAKALPLRLAVTTDEQFLVFARRVKSAIADAYSWEECFTWNHIETASSAQTVSLPLQYSYAELAGQQTYGEVTFEMVRQDVCAERYKLKLEVQKTGDSLGLRFHYDASRFSHDSVQRWAGHFQTLLAAALANPETPVSRLPLLDAAERQQLLVDWNQTAAEYPRLCLHQLFQAQAARTPDRPALRFAEQELSYRQLNDRSNQFAHYLRQLGVGPDTLVGLALDRSADMMVAVLGILKAGGAYVPLNPDNPKPRLAQQLSSAVVLVTEQKLLPQMPDFAGSSLCLDRDQQLWASQPLTNPETNTTPENLVYIIYTSGSTGLPKGVAVRHRNLVNYSHFIAQRLQLARFPDGLHFATVSTIGADLGNTCIFPSLLSGGCLHIIRYEDSTDSQRFARYAQQHPIDVLKIVPSHLQALLSASDGSEVLPRKYLITGGETLTPKLLEKIAALRPSCEVLNHYGPTETTVGSLTLQLKDYDWQNSHAASIPIGRPIANTQLYILDTHLEPVPLGVPGELYIAGDGVTAGYLNQPDSTAERFLANPFSSNSLAKMYRTGDLARYWPDGNVEFLGRGDDQVKIRGFRIELGEIETVLSQHPAVKQAVLLAREDEPAALNHGGLTGGLAQDKRLVAYVVAQRQQPTSPDALRSYLKQHLPDYMVPAAIVLLPKIPLTPNGKIDRKALPAPEQAPTHAQTFVPPATPTEQVVASIWAEVLRRHPISTADNFFDLGGHSLMATQVISRIRRSLNLDLPLRTLFESPTVAGLAAQIDKSPRNEAGTVAPPITPVSRVGDLPLSFAQQRLWLLDQLEPNNPLYNIPRTLRMKGTLNIDTLEASFNEIVRRHEDQRTTFVTRNGQPVQIIAPSLQISVPVRDLTHLSEPAREPEARALAEKEALQPFDLAKGPLVRAQLLRLAPSDHVLLLTMHHIISDAWSATVFFQELSAIYEAFAAGKPSPLPELNVQYADYAAWQRRWFQGDVLRQQVAYWRKQLHGAPPILELPADRPRPAQQSFRGALASIPFSLELSANLQDFSRHEGITLFMSLLAGFQSLLSRYSGQEQIVLGTDVANRPTVETEKLIGFFINLLPIRTDLSGNPTFRELLGRVRETALGAYAHQDMPFDKLVEELQPERSLSHNPIVQALFVMQNIPRTRKEIAGLELSAFEMPLSRSKFDLAVFMVETDSGLVGHWVYSTDLFDRSTIQRMAGHLEVLLGSAVAQPETRIAALEIFTESEKQERGAGTKQRKESQLKKLMTAAPKAVSFSSTDRSGEES